MAKLSDLIPKAKQADTLQIMGAEIPVAFTFKTLSYVEDTGKGSFQRLLNLFENQKTSDNLDPKMIDGIYTLLYAMIRTGGTVTTPDEVKELIPITELANIAPKINELFGSAYFQQEDADKIKADDSTKK